MVLDHLADQMKAGFQHERRWNSLVARNGAVLLVKPQTFMNASGEAAAGLMKYFKLQPAEVLVVVDDVDLPLGTLRLRPSGSAGGHNGLRSLIRHLGSELFPRLRIGISQTAGRPEGERLASHVLGKFSVEERATLPAIVSRASQAVHSCLRNGLEAAMNAFNGPHPAP